MNIEDMFMKVLFAFLVVGAIAYFAIVVSSTPARCWLSHAPFTCAKMVELEQIIKDNKWNQ